MAADPVLALRKQALTAIKARIVHLTEQAGEEAMSQSELAETLGLTRSRLNLLMNERAAEFNLEALLRVAMRADLSVRLRITRPYSGD